VTTGRAAADEIQRQALLSLCRSLHVGGIKVNVNDKRMQKNNMLVVLY
jgi:hypothetical protein